MKHRKKATRLKLKRGLFQKPVLLLLVFVLGFGSVGTYFLFKGKAYSNAKLGIYDHCHFGQDFNDFSNWAGREVTVGGCFAATTNGEIWTWPIDVWGNWLKAKDTRIVDQVVDMFDTTNDVKHMYNGGNYEATAAGFQRCIDGQYDGRYQRLAQAYVNAGVAIPRLVIRLGHEHSGDWYAWSSRRDPELYAGCFRRLVTAMRSVPNFKASFSWNGAPGVDTIERAYPGDAYVDHISFDQYDLGGGDAVSRWDHMYNRPFGLKWYRDFAAAHNKPLTIPEWGLWTQGGTNGGGGDNPYYIEKMYEYIRDNNVLYHIYFNVDGDVDHKLSSYPNSQAKFKQLFGGSNPFWNTEPQQPQPTTAADLIVTNITWAPANPAPGQEVTFSATIKNQGTAASPANTKHGVVFRVNNDTNGDMTWADTFQGPLAIGESKTVTATGGKLSKASWTALTAGAYTITAQVDDDNRTSETNESNNELSASLTVGGTNPGTTPKVSQTNNLLSGKTFTSSTGAADATRTITKINDGIESDASRYVSTLGTSPVTLSTDLGVTYNLSKVSILWAGDTTKNYDIQVSSNNTTWTTIATGVTNNTSPQLIEHTITSTAVPGRYMRIVAKDLWNTSYGHSIWEIGAYGTTSAITKPGDLNNDGQVNIFDLSKLLVKFNQPGTVNEGDLNGDGLIGIADLSIMMTKWGS